MRPEEEVITSYIYYVYHRGKLRQELRRDHRGMLLASSGLHSYLSYKAQNGPPRGNPDSGAVGVPVSISK